MKTKDYSKEYKKMKIGSWVTECCCHDARQIKTQNELELEISLAKENWENYSEDGCGLISRCYKTKEDLVENECTCDVNKDCYLLNKSK